MCLCVCEELLVNQDRSHVNNSKWSPTNIAFSKHEKRLQSANKQEVCQREADGVIRKVQEQARGEKRCVRVQDLGRSREWQDEVEDCCHEF